MGGGGGGEGILTVQVSICTGDSVRLQFPKLPGQFTGTGDLFTALLLAWMHQGLQVGPAPSAQPHPLPYHCMRCCVCHLQVACEKTIATMQAVLKRTMDTAKGVIVRVLIEQQPMLRSYSYLVVSLGSHNDVIAK